MRLMRLLPLLLLAACSDATGPGAPDVALTVSVNEDAPPGQNNVTVQVRNEGSRTVYVENACGNIIMDTVERRADGRWEPGPGGVICFAYSPPIALARGESASSTIAIAQPGRYRSTVRVATGAEDGEFTPVREEFDVGA